jgi:hypothetical protein
MLIFVYQVQAYDRRQGSKCFAGGNPPGCGLRQSELMGTDRRVQPYSSVEIEVYRQREESELLVDRRGK